MTTQKESETENLLKKAQEYLKKGDIKLSRESFEAACTSEENQGKNPEENKGLVTQLQTLLLACEIAKVEMENPLISKKLNEWYQKTKESLSSTNQKKDQDIN